MDPLDQPPAKVQRPDDAEVDDGILEVDDAAISNEDADNVLMVDVGDDEDMGEDMADEKS
jgi:hypothetical protein